LEVVFTSIACRLNGLFARILRCFPLRSVRIAAKNRLVCRKNLAIQRTLLIKTTSDNKKGSFAQQMRKAAQTVGIAHPHCGAPQGSVSGNAVSML